MLDAHERDRSERLQVVAECMSGREAARAAFARLKPLLVERLLRPRVQAVIAPFPHAHAADGDTPDGVHIQVVFDHVDRYPVKVTLMAGAMLDAERGVVSVFTHVEFVPLLSTFDRGAHHDVPLSALLGFEAGDASGGAGSHPGDEWDAAGAWLEERLLGFLETYLTVETDPRYQQMGTHIDPVCCMRVQGGSAAARREFRGHSYFFCSEACDARFMADPAYYVDRRRESVEA